MPKYRLAPLCLALLGLPALGQANGLCNNARSKTPFFMYENLQGSPGAAAQSYELDSTFTDIVGTRFNVSGGLPLYFTRGDTGTSGAQERVQATGVGDSFLTLTFTPIASGVAWTTCLTGYAPTGSSDLGLGTGRTLVNWNNHLEHDFAAWAPYADLGLANTTIARRVLRRAYTSLGKVANLDAGGQVSLGTRVTLDFSGYADLPSGAQKIYSRLVRRRAKSGRRIAATVTKPKPYQLAHITVGGPSLDRDYGATAALDFTPRPYVDLGFGYTRSAYQGANIVAFNVGVNISDVVARF